MTEFNDNFIIRKFIISCNIFGGYEVSISINDCNNTQDIVNIVLSKLKTNLDNLKLKELSKKIDNTHHNYHIHDYNIEDILLSSNEKIFYICNHNCNFNTSIATSDHFL